jgi:hypothetical protein
VAAIVAHDALGLAGRARRVEDVERVGGLHRHARRGLRRRERLAQSRSRPATIVAALRALQQDHAGPRLVLRLLDRLVEQRLVGTTRDGSMPQDAVRISFGAQSSMRVASSLAAKPPNTTECTAPSARRRASPSPPRGPSACRG